MSFQPLPATTYIGRRIPLVDGKEKVTGAARYPADLRLPGMLFGRPVLSPYAHARIRAIRTDRARQVPGVVAVLTAADLPIQPEPTTRSRLILARDRVVFRGQPVALVLAENEFAARDGADAVEVDYEPLRPAVDPLTALAEREVLVWPGGVPGEKREDADVHAGPVNAVEQAAGGNLAARSTVGWGDVDAGLAEADLVLETTYRTQFVHQNYLEPHAVVAAPDPVGGGLTVYTSTQGQYIVRDLIADITGLPKSAVRVVPLKIGGGFGAKYGTLEPLAVAAALAVRRPVGIFLTRAEDLLATTPAPATIIRLKTGVRRDGTLTALDADIYIDSGIYRAGISGIMTMLLGGYYRWPNLQIRAWEVLTNKPATGAYRAPGAPQATFAIESQMDELARQLDLDPLEVRLQNVAGKGDRIPAAADRRWPEVGAAACLRAVQNHPIWRDRRRNGRGVGLALGGWPGGLGPATAVCRLEEDGTLQLHVGSIDLGNGTDTALILIAAEVLGLPPEKVRIVFGDTALGPFAGASGGSKITYTVGAAVLRAAQAAREKILRAAAEYLEANPDDLELKDGYVSVRGVPGRGISLEELGRRTYAGQRGLAPIVAEGESSIGRQAPGFAAQVVEVEVDPETGLIRPVRFLAVQDVGRAINPLTIEGQIHGGATQGLGWALMEQLVFDEQGELLSGSFLDYALPRAVDIPGFEVELVEVPSELGPFGARGVGEPPIVPTLAAVANAVRDAAGVRITELPITPERLWRALATRF